MKDFFNKNQSFILAILILGTCFIIIAIVLFRSVDKDIQMFILGALLTTITSIISYYFGSSTGSKDKQKKLDEINNKDENAIT